MASCRSTKRRRMASRFGSRSGKVLLHSRKLFRVSRFWGKKIPGVHHVVSVWSRKHGHRLYGNSSYDENWSSKSIMWSPFPRWSPYLRGRCNGLLLFVFQSNDAGWGYVVWEPSTKKLQVIPTPPSEFRPCVCKKKKCITSISPVGRDLLFDSQSGDYKFFRFTRRCYNYRNDQGHLAYLHEDSFHVEVYSLKNNTWKELTHPLYKFQYPVRVIEGPGDAICANGVCYWRAECAGDTSFMLSYSFLTEEFSTFRCPEFDTESVKLVEKDGLLGLLIYPQVIDSYDSKATIWLKVYTSSQTWLDVKGSEVTIVGFHKPLWFGKRNGSYYLLLKGPKGDLHEYDYTRKVFNKIHKMHSPSSTYDFEFVYETKTKNNANIWHSTSFNAVKLQK